MDAGQTRPAVVAVLDEIAQWRTRADAEYGASVQEIEREEDGSRRAIEEAQRQLLALAALRRELEERHLSVGRETERREAQALRDGLATDRQIVAERAQMLAAAIGAREAEINAALADPDVATAVTEYEKFVEIEASLAALPSSYRRAILEHHEKVRRRLDPIIQASNAGPPKLDLPPVGIGVLLAADPPEGQPEGLVVAIPVPFEIYGDWAERKEDLGSLMAYRMVAAVSRILEAAGAADAPVQYVSLYGCLAIQVWLGDHEASADLREHALEAVGAVGEEAEELAAAGIEIYGLWVRPQLLTGTEA
jgi:hypothetical protein